jgi:FkbM family methyltransferase
MLRRATRKIINTTFTSRAFARLAKLKPVRDAFFVASAQFTPFILADSGKLKYLVRTEDVTLARSVFAEGGFEEHVMAGIITALDQFGYRDVRSRTFVDVGANIGTSSIPAVTVYGFARAIAIEPEPVNFRLLSLNAQLNDAADRIKSYRFALSDEKRDLVFELCSDNSGDGRVRTTTNGGTQSGMFAEASRQTIVVPGVTFDQLVEDGTIDLSDIGLVWMDTQGHEGHVLAGAKRLTGANVPVLMEYWPYALDRAGGWDKLEPAVRDNYTHFVDVRKRDPAGKFIATPSAEIKDWRGKYLGREGTDLLLLKL